MLPSIRKYATAAVAAIAIASSAAAPAHALGKNERKFLQGVAAAAIIGAIINDNRRRSKPAPQPQAQYYTPVPQTQYRAPRTRNPGRIIGSSTPYGSGLHQTPTARVFNSYSRTERYAIQRRLAAFGYYGGAIDGAFGPRTHQAIYEFARTANKQEALKSTSGAYAVLDALLA